MILLKLIMKLFILNIYILLNINYNKDNKIIIFMMKHMNINNLFIITFIPNYLLEESIYNIRRIRTIT